MTRNPSIQPAGLFHCFPLMLQTSHFQALKPWHLYLQYGQGLLGTVQLDSVCVIGAAQLLLRTEEHLQNNQVTCYWVGTDMGWCWQQGLAKPMVLPGGRSMAVWICRAELLSSKRKKLVLPGVPKTWPKVSTQSFVLSSHGHNSVMPTQI